MSVPNPRIVDGTQLTSEITLRDLFAAAALTGMLADYKCDGEPEEFARRSYRVADAMLQERAK